MKEPNPGQPAVCSSTSGGHISGGRSGAKVKEYVPGPRPRQPGSVQTTAAVASSPPGVRARRRDAARSARR
jgi:hypothetical protein